MSSDSSDGEEFVAGTPAKSRPLLSARCTNEGGRFARASSSLTRPEARVALPLSAPTACVPVPKPDAAFQRVAPSAGFAAAAPRPATLTAQQPFAVRFSAPSLAPATAQWGGQGASLLQRGAGGFSRIAQERQNAYGAVLDTRAPPYRSEPDVSAAAAVGGGMPAPVSAPQPRVEGLEARCVHTLEPLRAPLKPLFCSCIQTTAAAAPFNGSPRRAVEKRLAAEGEDRQPKRARPKANAGARSTAPRSGATRDNFVRLQLGKAGRNKGAGGRKFVTGCVTAVCCMCVACTFDVV